MSDQKGLFELIDGKSAFIMGLVTSVLSLGTIGFIALSVFVFSGRLALMSAAQAQLAAAPSPSVPTQPTQPAPTAPTGPVDVGVGHFPVKGDAKAKVTVIEFADFRCPFCERYYTQVEKQVMKEYVDSGKVKYAFRGYAFLGPASTAAHEAGECANEQGQFWKFHDWMYDHQADESNTEYYSNDNLIKYAADLGLDKAKFTSCLTSHKYADKVTQDLNEGQAAGVNGTPTTFVNGVAIVGAVPYAQLKAAIDAALAK